MFAVYDGHGKKGHDCASFAKKKLPSTVAKEIRQARVNKYKAALKRDKVPLKGVKLFYPPKWPKLNADEYKICCVKGFIETNRNLHKSEVRFVAPSLDMMDLVLTKHRYFSLMHLIRDYVRSFPGRGQH